MKAKITKTKLTGIAKKRYEEIKSGKVKPLSEAEFKNKLEVDSMINQINLLLLALPYSEVKDIYEHLTSADVRGLKLYVVLKHECK